MRSTCVRPKTQRTVLFAAGATMLLSAFLAAPFFSAVSAIAAPPPTEPMTLMGTLAEWKYPGSKMLGGASMSDGGDPSVPDVRCQAILTTPEPIDKVTGFYSKLASKPPDAGKRVAEAETKPTDTQAVGSQDDSKGRPVTLRIIVVNKADTTTTLVISRAANENETHIAWTHYRRFEDQPNAGR
jgi:hypothetical protein